jgi:hypothetical protein
MRALYNIVSIKLNRVTVIEKPNCEHARVQRLETEGGNLPVLL